MWPGGSFGARGRIAPAEMHEVGRTLVFADAPEWRETVAAVVGRGSPPPDRVAEVADACVRLMSQWRSTWSTRPEVVVSLATTGSPALTAVVADHLASVGHLERATLDGPSALPDLRELSSSDEAAFWRDHLTGTQVPDVTGRAVLLLVDASSSLWPVTVASAVLRRAGASVVLPLLLHRRP